MTDDMSQYLGLFLDEAGEQMELLERDILQLEQNPSQELLNGIFRAAHTLKGSSRAMGFTAMGELTHAMEDIFDQLRQDRLRITRELIDALFAGLDALKAMTEEIASRGASELDTSELTARLRKALDANGLSSVVETGDTVAAPAAQAAAPERTPVQQHSLQLSDPQLMAVKAAQDAGLNLTVIRVTIAEDCIMKSVRAILVMQALERVGSLLATTPDEEALENEEFELHFEALIATDQDEEAVSKAGLSVTEIVAAEVYPYHSNEEETGGIPPAASQPVAENASISPHARVTEETLAPLDERQADAGPEARGKSSEEVQKLATEKKQSQTVRVDVARLDTLLNLVGELVMDRNRIAQLCNQLNLQMAANDIVDNLHETAAHVGRITDELQEEIMKARMLPISNVFSRFPRMVRDLAQKLEKEIEFLVEGGDTELDRSVIEVIGDPLIHMLRNSVDHGIELPAEREQAGKPVAGTVRLSACHAENHIVISIEDDGKGMDPEKLRGLAVKKDLMTEEAAARLTDKEAFNLIFMPGFSTAQVVSDVSGRGVGMDIVRSNLQKLGAQIDIDSRVGFGSKFTVKMPLTLAIIRGLLVNVRGCVYAMPLASVVETISIPEESIHVINHQEVIMQRGRVLPIIRLRSLYRLDEAITPAERLLFAETGASLQDSDIGNEAIVTAPEEPAPRKGRRGKSRKAEPSTSEAETAPLPEAHKRTTAPKSGANALHYVVIVGHAEKQYGLVVDTLIGEQEVVIKTLGKFLGEIQGISGATILGDGRVALIMDISGVVACAASEKGRVHAT